MLDGRNIPALNTQLREAGVSDNDRHEILKFASWLSRPASDEDRVRVDTDGGENQ